MIKCPRCGMWNEEYTERCVACNTTLELTDEQKRELILEDRQKVIEKYGKIYEYQVERIVDNNRGATNIDIMEQTIFRMAIDGWRLHTVFTNELGRNQQTFSGHGMANGTNETIDEVVLIFEREIKK